MRILLLSSPQQHEKDTETPLWPPLTATWVLLPDQRYECAKAATVPAALVRISEQLCATFAGGKRPLFGGAYSAKQGV